MSKNYSHLLPELEPQVRRLLKSVPHCHGWDHTMRVWRNAIRIAEKEGADITLVKYAALLHDIGRGDEFNDLGKTCHAEIGAARIPEILRQIGVDDEAFISHVKACVRTHRYRRRNAKQPASLEAKVLFDADKLDSMGAIGLGRAFHFAGRTGARVHNTQEEALTAESYSENDTAYREYLVKLQYLHESMLTEEGKRMAEKRHCFMQLFFDQLQHEATGHGA